MSEQAWAAGLFDGEGAVTICGGRPRLSLKMVDEECVRRFCDAVGAGKVYGPYRNNSGKKDGYPRKDFYMWVAELSNRYGTATTAIEVMRPWLGTTRLERIAAVFT